VTRVLIADDQALVRGGLRLIVEAQDDMEVVGEAEHGRDAVARAKELAPDVVLMDIRMPELDGIAATRELVAAGPPSTRILMLTTFDDDRLVYEAMRAGASGFLLKSAPPARLAEAIRIVTAGEALLAPSITRRLIEDFVRRPPPGAGVPEALAELTEREREVLVLVARGLSNAEIAAELVVGEATVKTHVNRVLTKLDLRDRTQAVVFAYENGVVRPGQPWPDRSRSGHEAVTPP
jgi:DNA-binding NarL/FixJ family response regulator